MSRCIKEGEINVTDIGISGRINTARGNAYAAKYVQIVQINLYFLISIKIIPIKIIKII